MRWPVLDGLSEDDQQRVLGLSRRRRFARGEVVFHAGDPADTLHLVVSGRFAVTLTSPLGDEVMLGIVSAGQAFGELALVADTAVRSATVRALEAAETWSLARVEFSRLRQSHPTVDAFLVQLLADRVRIMNRRLFEVLFTNAEERVRLRVLELARIYGPTPPIIIPFTQEQVAAFAGTTRVTTNRVLRQLQRDGIIELRRGRVIIPDALPDQDPPGARATST